MNVPHGLASVTHLPGSACVYSMLVSVLQDIIVSFTSTFQPTSISFSSHPFTPIYLGRKFEYDQLGHTSKNSIGKALHRIEVYVEIFASANFHETVP